ncbi:MAG: DnaA/Hda family protein [Candidatus Sulfotelmatobacter sp.]
MHADSVPYLALTPDLDSRVAALRRTAAKIKLILPADVTLYLAQNVRSNTSALEVALARLMAHSSLTRTQITLQYTQHVLADFIAAEARKVGVDPPQELSSLGSGKKGSGTGGFGTKQAKIRSRDLAEADRHFVFFLVKTRGGRKTIQVRHELEVNMRESERERLARRDVYERELERNTKKRKQR